MSKIDLHLITTTKSSKNYSNFSRQPKFPKTSQIVDKMCQRYVFCYNTFIILGLFLVISPICSLQATEQQVATAKQSEQQQAQAIIRSTQPTVDRQLDTPNNSPQPVSPSAPQVVPAAKSTASYSNNEHQYQTAKVASDQTAVSAAKQQYSNGKPSKQPSQTKKASLASQQNYDKYQLKATNSNSHNTTPSLQDSSQQVSSTKDASSKSNPSSSSTSSSSSSSASSSSDTHKMQQDDDKVDQNKVSSSFAHKKSNYNAQQVNSNNNNSNNKLKSSSFSLLKKLLPSFMTSAGPAAAAVAAASAVVDKHQMSHSRSSQSSSPLAGDGTLLNKASSKIINLLSSASKKSASAGVGAVPDHAPFFIRKPSIDRQAGFASGLLSNPLSLGLLFSAPLIPSLLLTPLAIAGLSPAMSAINNFFGDDEEASTPASNPLSVLTGPSSPLSSILQGSSGSSSSQQGSSPSSSSLALQAVQSFLGPPATTEKPLFNPGMFASQGIQNAMGSLASAASSQPSSSSSSGLSSPSSSLSQPSNSPFRNFLGGNFIQTAASMISPSFAAPPTNSGSSSSSSSSSSNQDSDDGPGLMQMASDVFDKVANYMSSDSKDIAPAASTSSGVQSSPSSSPLSTLVGLSNFSPFQLSSLLASSPFGSAVASAQQSGISSASGSTHSSSHGSSSAQPVQRAGFFSTLKNVYELFSSSFLRRQEVGDSNECQQRLICELHQRAMNSKLFRRSIQSNLMELAALDNNLQDQIKNNPMQARVDSGTKAMLNDFLKATNNFKNGRELVNCSKMFPKCSRAMLLSTANAHLTDPVNGKAIGKFSNLMKKMKFKSVQQHQNQWKLRKPTKSNGIPQSPRIVSPNNQYQATDYLQVAPLATVQNENGKLQPGQLTPADSLKLVQQIMMMSQQQQQQQQQQQLQVSQSQQVSHYVPLNNQPISLQYGQQQQQQPQQQQLQQNQMYNPNQATSYQSYASYQPANQQGGQPMSNIYTDAVVPMYSSTDSPYFMQSQSVPDMQIQAQQQSVQTMMQQNSNQQQIAPLQQIQQNQYQQYPSSTSTTPELMSINMSDNINNKKAQQQQTVAKIASAA